MVEERETLFHKLCEYLESEVEHGVMTLVQVHEVLEQLDPSPDKSLAYSKKWLEIKLHEKYHETLYFASQNGMQDLMVGIQGYEPVPTLEPMAPDKLLEFTSCNCRGDCSNQWCSCRKNDVKCISACGNCKGITCKNCTDDEEPGEDSHLDS